MRLRPVFLILICLCINNSYAIKLPEAALFFVSDKDGNVNVREKADTKSRIIKSIPNLSIIKAQNITGDWVQTDSGYIHTSRLTVISKEITDSIYATEKKIFSNFDLPPAYVLDKSLPHIVAFFDNDCEIAIWDVLQEQQLYFTTIPVCPDIHLDKHVLWVSESGWLGRTYDDDNNYGTIADYKLMKDADNSYSMVCTRFYPTVSKMSQKEIEYALNNYNKQGGTGMNAYILFAAYYNGSKEAKELLINQDNFMTDASGAHEYSDVLSLLWAYESNRDWKSQK